MATDTGVVSHFRGTIMVDFDKDREANLAAFELTGGAAAGGLTVRDYFAAHAISAAYRIVDHNEEEFRLGSDEEIPRLWKEGDENLIAANAYEIADAMMRERKRKPQEPCSVEEAFGL